MGASHTLKVTHVEFFSDKDEPEVDLGNIINSYTVPTTPNTRINKDHPIENVIGDVKSTIQIRRMTKPTSEQGFLSAVEAMQEELLQFKLQQVWILLDLPSGKRAIGTKWVFRNKKDERGIVIRNKARCEILLQTPSYVGKTLVKDGDADDVMDSPFELVAYTDSDYAGVTQDKNSTNRGCQFLGNMLISWQCKKQTVVATSTTEAEYVDAASFYGQIFLQKVLMQEGFSTWHVKRGRDTKIPQSSGPPIKVGDEAVHKELGNIMERTATIASSLEAEQESGNINRTQSMETLNGSSP
ncbi:hypothetical protein Tco_1352297 [Tanacetum coccineum]